MFVFFSAFFFFSSRRRHTRCGRDWSSDVCSSDLDTRSLAFEQIDLQLRLQLTNVAGYRRLTDAQRCTRFRKTQVLGHRQKHPVSKIHSADLKQINASKIQVQGENLSLRHHLSHLVPIFTSAPLKHTVWPPAKHSTVTTSSSTVCARVPPVFQKFRTGFIWNQTFRVTTSTYPNAPFSATSKTSNRSTASASPSIFRATNGTYRKKTIPKPTPDYWKPSTPSAL